MQSSSSSLLIWLSTLDSSAVPTPQAVHRSPVVILGPRFYTRVALSAVTLARGRAAVKIPEACGFTSELHGRVQPPPWDGGPAGPRTRRADQACRPEDLAPWAYAR